MITASEIGVYVGGFVCGALYASFIWFRIHTSMLKRLLGNDSLERLAEGLERRREAIDSEREDEVPADAGPPGDEASLFETRPGALHLAHLAEKLPENRWKTFDTGGLSTSMDSARVESDQDSD